jgi:hypothetical protein
MVMIYLLDLLKESRNIGFLDKDFSILQQENYVKESINHRYYRSGWLLLNGIAFRKRI